MDALVATATDVARIAGEATPRIVLVPTAAARQRPDVAAMHGERAFVAAAARAGTPIDVGIAGILSRADAADPRAVAPLETAHLVHFPGGDPDQIPTVLRDTPAWMAIRRAHDAGACIAGASAGAMAMAERCWTRAGAIDGLGLLRGFAVLPHYAPGRLAAWRTGIETADGARPLAWLGIDEQTLVIGRPGGEWRVAGRGRGHVIPAAGATRSAGSGELLDLG
ncbi:MAG: Type 1 glutamine amidotransferase-like domain-containing protein [Candidatus Limnocylindrales bacterium]